MRIIPFNITTIYFSRIKKKYRLLKIALKSSIIKRKGRKKGVRRKGGGGGRGRIAYI